MSNHNLVGWLRERLIARSPAAVVRFGDGEIRLLRADTSDAKSIEVANVQLRQQTGQIYGPQDVLDIGRNVRCAYDEADVLGIPGGVQFQGVGNANPLAALYAARVAAGRPPAAVARSILHHEILSELPTLLSGRRIGVITCRDVKPVIESRWGLEDVAVYQVPSQYRERQVDGWYEAALHDARIWPDAYDRVVAELTVREPGEVFLVGAGVFGKSLCIEVRRQGGIALDMGSALDHIAGKLTRPSMRRVLALHAQGMQAGDIATDLGDRYGGKPSKTDVDVFIKAVSPYLTDGN